MSDLEIIINNIPNNYKVEYKKNINKASCKFIKNNIIVLNKSLKTKSLKGVIGFLKLETEVKDLFAGFILSYLLNSGIEEDIHLAYKICNLTDKYKHNITK